ncbi:hypothetical protein PRUPE_6G081900 [Prunus persica]|uniref:Uncharacterized protein n=1 Tax=Prunus persica TaxID=3760 RepID=A0A251NLY1_PRUPE|nr:hypothetical protein PRUPE_6G081900 [Prunus persica]
MAEPLICSWTVFGIDYDERIQIFFQGNDHIKAMMSTRTTRGVCLVKFCTNLSLSLSFKLGGKLGIQSLEICSWLRCLTCTTVECEAKVAMLNAPSFFTSYIHLSQIFTN